MGDIGATVGNFSHIEDEELLHLIKQGDSLKRSTRYSLTCRDIGSVSKTQCRLFELSGLNIPPPTAVIRLPENFRCVSIIFCTLWRNHEESISIQIFKNLKWGYMSNPRYIPAITQSDLPDRTTEFLSRQDLPWQEPMDQICMCDNDFRRIFDIEISLINVDIRLACCSDQKLKSSLRYSSGTLSDARRAALSCGGVFSILQDNAIKREGSEWRDNGTIRMRD